MATSTKFRIADFRRVVDALDHVRANVVGGTRAEFLVSEADARLTCKIEAVQSRMPLVPVRFAEDLAFAAGSIVRAQETIARWRFCRAAAKAADQIDPSVLALCA